MAMEEISQIREKAALAQHRIVVSVNQAQMILAVKNDLCPICLAEKSQ